MDNCIELLDNIINKTASVHFVGIGGISMSSLAFITKNNGIKVTGSDKTPSSITEKLEKSGITIYYGHSSENVENATALVYTAAVKSDNPELVSAREKGIPVFTRAEYLGWLMRKNKTRIGVAGTHGKSTVTAMISSVYINGDEDPTVVCGAEIPDINGTYRIGNGNAFVFEACEYCNSFLSFYPTVAVITNIEYDHPDFFPNIDVLTDSFKKYVEIADYSVMNADDVESSKIISSADKKVVTFGIDNIADFIATDITFADGKSDFTVINNGRVLGNITLNIPGIHNVYNALAVCAVCLTEGISFNKVSNGLEKYCGIKRRFEYMGKSASGAIVYNDYAHHPSEISATIKAARSLNKRLVCLFQPHTFSRTFSLFDDFVKALEGADIALISDIYPARETNKWDVSSEKLAKSIKNGIYTGDIKASAEYIKENFGEGDLVLILGAGDIISAGNIILS